MKIDKKPKRARAYLESYPRILQLKVPVHVESDVHHILSSDLDAVLDKKQRRVFSHLFGVQTQLLRDDGVPGMYLWDVEAVLERMFSGRLIGSQLLWD